MCALPAGVRGYDGPLLFAWQCWHNRRRPSLGLKEYHGLPGGAGAQDAGELVSSPSGLPAGPAAMPSGDKERTHTKPKERRQIVMKNWTHSLQGHVYAHINTHLIGLPLGSQSTAVEHG